MYAFIPMRPTITLKSLYCKINYKNRSALYAKQYLKTNTHSHSG